MIYNIRSFAKLNLFLYVTGKREDGYHTICSLMAPVELHDDLEFSFLDNGIEVCCHHPDVPENESNLAYRAASLFFETAGRRDLPDPAGVRITIDKKIPVGGGLGGGSSNAASVLQLLNRVYGNLFSDDHLMEMGLSLGADVPFFISGTAAIARGIGQELEPCPGLNRYHVIICYPGISASTSDVYKKFDLQLTRSGKYNIKQSLNICSEGQGVDICDGLHNDLEKPACELYPEIRTIREEMKLLLNTPVFMTGSGSSLFALFSDGNRARNGFNALRRKWARTGRSVFLTSLR